jgi:CTP synthase
MTKFIFVTGSVISSLGKGTCSSSIGKIFKAMGLNVTAIKIDPYFNVDSGSMSPWQHGECYVLNDGTESDLDLGNYERFLNINLRGSHSITSGKVYKNVIEKERRGDYLGATVQMVPHITDYIQEELMRAAKIPVDGDKENDICIVELGGTIGDMEGLVFCEAIAQLTRNTLKENDSCFVHLSYVPTIHGDESKTKPTQQSMRTVRSLGIFPDFLILRSENVMKEDDIKKVSTMCQIKRENIIGNPNTKRIYDVPDILMKQTLHHKIAQKLGLDKAILEKKITLDDMQFNTDDFLEIEIGIIGKYTGSQDTYLSIIRSLEIASINNKRKLKIRWISSELEFSEIDREIDLCDSVIIPGGFGTRGIEGMIRASSKCRKENKKLLGICLGFQILCIEYARNVLGMSDANSIEFDKNTKHPIIIPVASEEYLGGTMRLGNMVITLDYSINNIYKGKVRGKRFRHRYGLNAKYIPDFSTKTTEFKIFGKTNDGMISNIQIGNSIGVQYHPEFGPKVDETFEWLTL